jgi:hypothetical protein
MPFEADLADALDRSTDNLDPDLDHLVGGAVKRGRSRRNRRNLGAGVGACAVLAVAGLVMPGVIDRARHGGDGEGIESVAFAAPRSAITGKQMIQAVEKSFTGGRFTDRKGQSNNPSDPSAGYVASGSLTLDDGHGLANVGVSAMRLKLPLQDADGLSCDTEQTPPRAEGDTCELKELPSSATLPGGALVMSEKIADRRTDGREAAHRWTTTLTVKSTGAQVQLVQWNTGGSFEADIPKPTRAAPPLSRDQAVAVLTGSVWSPILGAVA